MIQSVTENPAVDWHVFIHAVILFIAGVTTSVRNTVHKLIDFFSLKKYARKDRVLALIEELRGAELHIIHGTLPDILLGNYEFSVSAQ